MNLATATRTTSELIKSAHETDPVLFISPTTTSALSALDLWQSTAVL